MYILTLIFAIVSMAILFDRKIESLIPVALMGTGLLAYILGLAGGLRFTVYIIMALTAVLMVGAFSKVDQSGMIVKNILNVRLFIFGLCFVAIILIFKTHRVYFWDDLSYWAIYLKNVFTLNRIPLGIENCTTDYKDYTPALQLFQYLFEYGRKSFSEPIPFMMNASLTYALMLPIIRNVTFSKGTWKRDIVMTIIYVIFPSTFSTQGYYKLGLDYIMAVLFGYCIFLIIDYENDKTFNLIALSIAMSFLALIKTSGIVICLFAILFFAIKLYDTRKDFTFFKRFLPDYLIGFVTIIAYLSWKIWSKHTGNHGYLSDKVNGNIRAKFNIQFPSYTKEVVINYIKRFLTYPLTREKVGMTAALITAIVVFVLVVAIVRKRTDIFSVKLSVAFITGLCIFCVAHIYMYLFVFDEWEAHGLLEYDRYIMQYLGGLYYIAICYLYQILGKSNAGVSETSEPNAKNKKAMYSVGEFIPVILAIICIRLLPYNSMKQNLIPSNYDNAFEATNRSWVDKGQALTEAFNDKGYELPTDGYHTLSIFGNAWLDEYQYFVYEIVPIPVVKANNSPAIEPGNLRNHTLSLVEQQGIDYMYVTADGIEAFRGDIDGESSDLTIDGKPFVADTLYKFDKDIQKFIIVN